MAVRLQDVKYVDDRSQKLLCGYLRNIYNDHAANDDEHIIPDLVLNICLLFYFRREHFSAIVNWKKDQKNFMLSNDNMTVSLVDGCAGNVYGEVKIDSMSEIVCKWSIKVENQKTKVWAQYVELGVSGDEPPGTYFSGCFRLSRNSFICKGNGVLYGVCKVTDKCWDLNWEHGDVVDIKLDLRQRNIEYFINDKSIGVMYENIPVGEDINYRFVTYMGHDGGCVTIENFQCL